MLRRGLCLLLTAALCLTTGCVADRAAMQAEAEQALLAQQEEALRQEEAERRARQEERRRQAGEVLHTEMEEICRKYQVVGMSLAVFDEEGVFYRQSYGYADVEAGIPAGEDTIYRAASVSKCVTALPARGRLTPKLRCPDWDDVRWFPVIPMRPSPCGTCSPIPRAWQTAKLTGKRWQKRCFRRWGRCWRAVIPEQSRGHSTAIPTLAWGW